jgi:virginiamycin B lyase
MPEHTYIPRMQFAFDAAGNLWYLRLTPLSLELENDAIGRIDTTGHVEEFALPDNSNPVSLVSGPDGNLWATLAEKAAIARITLAGALTMFALPNGIQPTEMLVGVDRTLWFTAPKAATIGRITTDGVVSTFTLPAHTNPHDLTVGADGALWYVDTQHEPQYVAIGRMTADGNVRTYQIAATPTSGSTLVAAPDGSVWLTLYNTIGHIATDGAVTLYDAPTLDAELGLAILGTDHHLWFAEDSGVLGEFAT